MRTTEACRRSSQASGLGPLGQGGAARAAMATATLARTNGSWLAPSLQRPSCALASSWPRRASLASEKAAAAEAGQGSEGPRASSSAPSSAPPALADHRGGLRGQRDVPARDQPAQRLARLGLLELAERAHDGRAALGPGPCQQRDERLARAGRPPARDHVERALGEPPILAAREREHGGERAALEGRVEEPRGGQARQRLRQRDREGVPIGRCAIREAAEELRGDRR
ncbi:MAG: hypothetical protein M5U28_38825 [Sandaracinaceae bacterium]|nr:hypothetical protein [Sandaracinaceae bacterium]